MPDNSFSWDKILDQQKGEEAAAPPPPPKVDDTHEVELMSTLPFGGYDEKAADPTFDAPKADASKADAAGVNDELRQILSQLKGGAPTPPPAATSEEELGVPPAPKFEDIAPGEPSAFEIETPPVMVDGDIPLTRLSATTDEAAEEETEEIAVPAVPVDLGTQEDADFFSEDDEDEEAVAELKIEEPEVSFEETAAKLLNDPDAAPPVLDQEVKPISFAPEANASGPDYGSLYEADARTVDEHPVVAPPPVVPPTLTVSAFDQIDAAAPAPPAPPVTEEPAAELEGEEAEPNRPFDPSVFEIPVASIKNVASTPSPGREYGVTKKAADSMTAVNDLHIDDILRLAVDRRCSDIHLTVGLPPMGRIDGELMPLPYQPLDPQQTQRLIYEILNDERLEKFERTHELDFSYAVRDVGRFRFNVYQQRGAISAALRAIPTKIPDFESLGLPGIIREMAKRTSGLVLVTGPTGSGKSTTIASMIDDINNQRKNHILTIEDPIEYLHTHKQCMVNQREMHSDTYSFHNALRAVLREDPDIILVGELRDLETIEAALTLAETGHLVFGTLHTRNAPSTIDRIVDVFPKDAQAQIRVLLSNTLEGVVSQQLLPRLGGGRCAAIEIMIATPAIKNLIREGKTHQMYSSIETSGNMGMQTMDSSLAELYRQGKCDWEECVMRAIDKENFSRVAKRVA